MTISEKKETLIELKHLNDIANMNVEVVSKVNLFCLRYAEIYPKTRICCKIEQMIKSKRKKIIPGLMTPPQSFSVHVGTSFSKT